MQRFRFSGSGILLITADSLAPANQNHRIFTIKTATVLIRVFNLPSEVSQARPPSSALFSTLSSKLLQKSHRALNIPMNRLAQSSKVLPQSSPERRGGGGGGGGGERASTQRPHPLRGRPGRPLPSALPPSLLQAPGQRRRQRGPSSPLSLLQGEPPLLGSAAAPLLCPPLRPCPLPPPPGAFPGLRWPQRKKKRKGGKKQRRERRRRRARALPLLSPSLPLPPISTAANSWTGTTPAPASGTRSAPGRDGVTRGQRKLAWSTAAPGLPTQKPTSCIVRPTLPPTHYKAMPPTTTQQASLDFLTLASTTRAQQGPTPPS